MTTCVRYCCCRDAVKTTSFHKQQGDYKYSSSAISFLQMSRDMSLEIERVGLRSWLEFALCVHGDDICSVCSFVFCQYCFKFMKTSHNAPTYVCHLIKQHHMSSSLMQSGWIYKTQPAMQSGCRAARQMVTDTEAVNVCKLLDMHLFCKYQSVPSSLNCI